MNNEELNAAIAATPAPKVLLSDIEAAIVAKQYLQPVGTTLTLCVLTLGNGFTATGESACASPENYNQEIGEKLAYDNAVGKVWTLEAYLLRETIATYGGEVEGRYVPRVREWQGFGPAAHVTAD